MGSGFVTDAYGAGGMYEFTDVDLSGPESVIGKYMRLTGSEGTEACCQIKLKASNLITVQ